MSQPPGFFKTTLGITDELIGPSCVDTALSGEYCRPLFVIAGALIWWSRGKEGLAMSLPRRAFLGRAGVLAAGLGLASAGLPGLARPASAAAFDYTARETFDHFDEVFHSSGNVGQPQHSNEAGELAWGQSYVLDGFMKMYLTYGDTYYLDRLIHNVDIMLTRRDSERGVTDYRGLSLPAWRAGNHYTVGIAALPDAQGRSTLEFRSARAYANTASATVSHNADGTFTLVTRNAQYGYTDTYADLSMDPASPNFAERRIYDAYPSSLLLGTARDLGAGNLPTQGTYSLVPQPVIFAVHTGMITSPIASFIRVVRKTPALRDNPRYAAKAAEYLPVVREAIAVHDEEWQESGGEGYYQWTKGTPLPYDGVAQPVNQSTALGRTLAELASATGAEPYVSRAAKMARMFRNQLIDHADRTATWHYWPTFARIWEGYDQTGSPETDVSIYTPRYRSSTGGARQIEDCSHGAISVDFAALAYESGIVFRYDDLVRLARTFTQNLATTDADGIATVFTRVDGTGVAPSGQYLQAPRWMAANPWDTKLFTHCRAIYDARAPEPGFGSALLAVAALNWGATH